MPRGARSESVDPLTPQFIHVWNRCVRRAFLCGRDRYYGKSFEHRRVLRIHAGKSDSELDGVASNSGRFHAWERLDNVANEYSGWLSPIEIDEVTDPLGADVEPNGRRCSRKGVLTMSVLRYIDLVEWCGREIRSDKRGSIPSDLSPILGRLGLDGQTLLGAVLKSGNGLQAAEEIPSDSSSQTTTPAPAT